MRVRVFWTVFASLGAASSVSYQVDLNDVNYFLPAQPTWSFSSWCQASVSTDSDFIPLTVISGKGSTLDEQDIRTTLESYNTTDDVWNVVFTKIIYLQSNASEPVNLVSALAPDYPVQTVLTSSSNTTNTPNIPAGPYFVHTYSGAVYRAYKLYVDENQAFIQSSYQDQYGDHHTVQAGSRSAGGLTVAVPSRLYYTRTELQPLAGVRISVKDLYDLKGMKTSGGNKALFDMITVANATATAVQKLIDAGAVVVGKNKLSEFAFAGPQVPEHLDYLLPHNPRGDGYNSPGDSSGGSAASVASYDWLDASMGSDTGGSIRGPALNNGIYGNRPSHGAVSLQGALPLSSAMDTSGMLTRDPHVWNQINKVLYAGFATEYMNFPRNIYVYAQVAESGASYTGDLAVWYNMTLDFVNSLSKQLNATASLLSLDEVWNTTAPSGFNNLTLASVTNRIYGNLTEYEQWNLFGRQYVKDYATTHNGDFPHLTPGTRSGWLRANSTMTEETHQADLRALNAYSQWASTNIFHNDSRTCSDAIFLYFTPPTAAFQYKADVSQDAANPFIEDFLSEAQLLQQQVLELNATLACNTTLGDVQSCNETTTLIAEYTASLRGSSSTSPGRFASLAGIPDFAVTLGSMALKETVSNSTGRLQSLPWGVDFVTGRGCDFMLQNLISELYRVGLVREVKTGAVAL